MLQLHVPKIVGDRGSAPGVGNLNAVGSLFSSGPASAHDGRYAASPRIPLHFAKGCTIVCPDDAKLIVFQILYDNVLNLFLYYRKHPHFREIETDL